MEPASPLPKRRRSSSTDAEPTGSHALLLQDLRDDVEALTCCGDRRPGGPGHERARDHVARRLVELELPSYAGDGHLAPYRNDLVNVLATVHGADRHRRPLVLATNYDGSPGSPGAGENAAAVAVILAVAARLRDGGLERGVVVALVDDSARPRHRDTATGATVLLTDQRRHDMKAAIVLDRLGHRHDDAAVAATVLVTGAETDARMASVLRGVGGEAARLLPIHRRYRPDVALSAPFVDARLPYLELFGARWRGHGTADDVAERLDFAHLASLVGVIERLVLRLDEVRLPGPFEGSDSSPFELERLEGMAAEDARATHPEARRRRIDDAVAALGGLVAS